MTTYAITGSGTLGLLGGSGARVYRAKRVGSGGLGALGGAGVRVYRAKRVGAGSLGALAGACRPFLSSLGHAPLRRVLAPADGVSPTIPTWPMEDPAEQVDFDIDWSARLAPGDAITSAAWSAQSGIHLDALFLVDGHTTRAWLSGGTVGTHDIVCAVGTAFGERLHQTVHLPIGPR